MKVSYSCMPSMKSKLNNHNRHVLGNFNENQESNVRLCNCNEPIVHKMVIVLKKVFCTWGAFHPTGQITRQKNITVTYIYIYIYTYSILPITRTYKGPMKMVWVNESSSYRGFELPGLYCIYINYWEQLKRCYNIF